MLYVFNLPFDISKEEVNNLFIGYEVEHIELIKKKSGNPSGTALAQFSTQNQAMSAFQLNQTKHIRGRIICLNFANKNDIRNYHDGEFCAKVRKSDEDYKYTHKFDRNHECYEYFSSDLRNDLKEGFNQINVQFTKFDDRFTKLEGRFTKMEDRLTQMGRTLDNIFAKLLSDKNK